MTTSNTERNQTFVPVPDTIPKEWELARQQLSEYFRLHANQINLRTVGVHSEVENLTGDLFPPSNANPREKRTTFRKIFNFGPLPAAGQKTLAHGIAFDVNFTLISMWISATNPTVEAISVQYGSRDATDSIRLSLDATNIILDVTDDYSAFIRSWVIVEYLKQE